VDPLDGTTNFAHGFPQFAVSIALEHAGEVVLGVVQDALREETFVASRGGGARLKRSPDPCLGRRRPGAEPGRERIPL
jgi:myo-inositol-1(or 4)-monophosphatase